MGVKVTSLPVSHLTRPPVSGTKIHQRGSDSLGSDYDSFCDLIYLTMVQLLTAGSERVELQQSLQVQLQTTLSTTFVSLSKNFGSQDSETGTRSTVLRLQEPAGIGGATGTGWVM